MLSTTLPVRVKINLSFSVFYGLNIFDHIFLDHLAREVEDRVFVWFHRLCRVDDKHKGRVEHLAKKECWFHTEKPRDDTQCPFKIGCGTAKHDSTATLSSRPCPRPEFEDSGQNLHRQEARHLQTSSSFFSFSSSSSFSSIPSSWLPPLIKRAEGVRVGSIWVALTARSEGGLTLAVLAIVIKVKMKDFSVSLQQNKFWVLTWFRKYDQISQDSPYFTTFQSWVVWWKTGCRKFM